MPCSLQFSRGFRRLVDAQQKYMRNGLITYLRLRDFPDIQEQPWAGLGFSIAPTGTLEVGTTDIQIIPQPTITPMSIHNIGQSMGKLRFGARTFKVSQTFVERVMAARNFTNPTDVWKDPSVVGLVEEGLLFSIEDYRHYDYAGKIVFWHLICNANERR